jgi:hypothetical protein
VKELVIVSRAMGHILFKYKKLWPTLDMLSSPSNGESEIKCALLCWSC